MTKNYHGVKIKYFIYVFRGITMTTVEIGKLEQKLNYESGENLKYAQSNAEKGIIDFLDYYLENAVRYSNKNISKEVEEIKQTALANHSQYNSKEELIEGTRKEVAESKPIFYNNILGYAEDFAKVFDWDISEEIQEIRKEYDIKEVEEKVIDWSKINEGRVLNKYGLRPAGYCDI